MSEIIKCPACNMIVAKCDCDELRTELAIRNDLIRRLKEDAERLYTSLENFAIYDDFVALTMHKQLMKELEDKR